MSDSGRPVTLRFGSARYRRTAVVFGGTGPDREHDGHGAAGVAWVGMARRRPTDDDRNEAIETALNGLARGDELGDIAARLAPLHPPDNTFPGEVLLDLAAAAIGASGANRQSPLEFEGIRERHLSDGIAHTKAQHHKSKYALRAAAMLHGGVDPGLLNEVQWWRTDDLWYWSLEALATYVRAAADRTGQPVESICRRIANEHHIAPVRNDAS
jgi:hypothetical protein